MLKSSKKLCAAGVFRRAAAIAAIGAVMAVITATGGRAATVNQAGTTGKGDAMRSFTEYEAIRKVMNLYIEAGREAKSDIMKPAFHKDAIMYGVAGTEAKGGPIQNLYDLVDGGPKAVELKAEITTIDIADNIAHVRLEADNWNGARYTDMFLLLKDKGDWKIITKVFLDHK